VRSVVVFDGKGRQIEMPSIALTAKEMGMPPSTVWKRISDGNWIHRDGYVPVKVRYK